ncbi:MAG: autotransporter domain-containing protein [Alphaproteobacteria bacterium]|nr:autotransporter domain-containing protein [Alphaproteobacteria bacterium]
MPTGTASFGASNTASLTFGGSTSLGGMTFGSGAPAYTFSTNANDVSFTGAGIVNGSSNAPTFNVDNSLTFNNSSTAANARFNISSGGAVGFFDSSTAAGAVINNVGGNLLFDETATAGNAVVTNSAGATMCFCNTATAGNATIVNTGSGTTLTFFSTTSAGTATITNSSGGSTVFTDDSTAGNATITVNSGSNTIFQSLATAGNATIITNSGGAVAFQDSSTGGAARFVTNGGGLVDFSALTAPTTAGSIEGAGDYELGANQLTVGSNNLSTTVSGGISGAGGSLVKVGLGTLTLSGSNSYTGATTVEGGRLAVNGSITSDVTVGTAGNLGGSGTINGNVTNNGMLSPGNSIGTLTISGDYTQAATGVYQVEINAAGQSDRVNVSGTATLGGTVSVLAQPGLYTRNTSYTILSSGTRVGTYSSVSSNFAFMTPTLSYVGDDVLLNLTLAGDGFRKGAQTANQKAIGAALDQAAANASGDFNNVINALASLDTANGGRALDMIGGQNYSGFSTLSVQSVLAFMNSFTQQVGGNQESGSQSSSTGGGRVMLAEACDVACEAAARWGAWGGGLAGAGTVAGDTSSRGVTYNLGGFAAGIDYRFDSRFLAGVAAGYSGANLFTQGIDGRGTSDTVQVALYGKLTEGAAYLDGLLGYARSENRMQRPIIFPGIQRTASGQTHADQFFGQVEAGYRIGLGGLADAFVTPFARLQASTSTQAAFTETGADSLNLNVAQQTTQSLRSVLGAQIGGSIDAGWREKLNLVFRLGWSHEYADTSRPVTASFAGAPALAFTTNGAAAPRNGAVLGLSASTAIAQATSYYLRYDGDLAGDNTSHILSAGVRMIW